MRKIFSKPTIVYVLGTLILLIGIPSGIYGLTLDGGASLGGVLIFIGVFVVLFLVILDRILVRKVNQRKLNLYEFVFILLCFTIFLYKERTLIIDNQNENINFLVVIQNPGNLKSDQYSIEFPFSKKVVTDRDFIIVDNMSDNVHFNIPKSWSESYYYNVYEFEKYPKVNVYAKTDYNIELKINQNFLDSLINKN
jgi:hypothetical protein